MTLLFMPFRLAMICTGFTFTDIADFCPLLSLVIGMAGAIWLSASKDSKIPLPLLLTLGLMSLGPLLPNIGLYFLAREFQSVQGVWPQVMMDDPKQWYGNVSAEFDLIYGLVIYLEAFSGAWVAIFFALFFAAYSRLSRRQKWTYWCGVLGVQLLVVMDLGNLYSWWLD